MAQELTDVLTDREAAEFAAEIERQLRELGPQGLGTRRGGTEPSHLPERQRLEVERVTSQPFRSFLTRFRAVARRDLCDEGGMLHERWRQVRDMTTEERTKIFALVLSAIGLIDWKAIVVPVVVMFTHLGVETICQEPADP